METNKNCKDCGIKIDTRATRCKPCSSKGKNNGMFIDGHTIKKYYCINCNKKITWQTALYGTKRCYSCGQKERLKNKHNHPNYIENLIRKYPLEFSNILKEEIRDRDNRTCQMCFKNEKELYRELDIHHIDYNKINLKSLNLISLCSSCHMKTNFKRDYYYAYFTYIMEKIYGN